VIAWSMLAVALVLIALSSFCSESIDPRRIKEGQW